MTALNRLGALLLGIIMAALGLVVVAETIAITVWNRAWPVPVLSWRDHLSTVSWSDKRVLAVSIIVLVVGLLVLTAQFRRVRPRQLRTAIDDGDRVWEIRRRSVERQTASAVRGIRGVERASARTTGKTDRWGLTVSATAAGNVVDPDNVRRVVEDQLAGLGAPQDTPLKVSVRGNGKRP
jgi:hypothetical protein